jgi:hypothetical protein
MEHREQNSIGSISLVYKGINGFTWDVFTLENGWHQIHVSPGIVRFRGNRSSLEEAKAKLIKYLQKLYDEECIDSYEIMFN